jgi:hypothetical protein
MSKLFQYYVLICSYRLNLPNYVVGVQFVHDHGAGLILAGRCDCMGWEFS